MFLAISAALAVPLSDFAISDTTDNVTGKRSVSALQIDPDTDQLNFLQLRCDNRQPAVVFRLYDYTAPNWAIVTLSNGDKAETPMIFERVEETTNELRLYGDPTTLVRSIKEGEVREFVVQAPQLRSISFSFGGLDKAWQRVTAACR